MTQVFVCAASSATNIGSSVFRRGYLDCLRERGSLVVWVGRSSPDYVSGLGLAHDDIVVSDFRLWFGRAALAAGRGRAIIAEDAGDPSAQTELTGRRALHMSALALLMSVGLAGRTRGIASGQPVVTSGGSSLLALPYRVVDTIGVRALDSAPQSHEWAFRLGTDITQWNSDRPFAALVLRGDRPAPSDQWIEWFEATLRRLGLEAAVLVHSTDDYLAAQSLSRATGGSYRAWYASDHAEQERSVRDVYARSAIVISDRVDALVVGATEGAVPIGWVESSTGTTGSLFDAIDMTWVGRWEGDDAERLPSIGPTELLELQNLLHDAVTRMRARVGGPERTAAHHAVG